MKAGYNVPSVQQQQQQGRKAEVMMKGIEMGSPSNSHSHNRMRERKKEISYL
jgi:hypothetical protein